MRASSAATLTRLLAEHGLSEREIDRGLEYAEAAGATTVREGYVLALSRRLYTDQQLASGLRFTFAEGD